MTELIEEIVARMEACCLSAKGKARNIYGEQCDSFAVTMPNDIRALIASWRERGEALKFGIGAAINELVARELPTEWSRDSGIGTMLRAISCSSLTFDENVRAVLNGKPK